MMVYRDEPFDALETMTPAERTNYTDVNLTAAMARTYERSISGRELFERAGIKPSDIRTTADLAKLPVTRKNDIIELERKRPYAGFLTIPVEDINRVFITPGPIYEPLHDESIAWFARAFWAAGFRKGDVVVNTFSYHLSPGGLLFHEAIRSCGATAVSVGVGNTEILIRTMLDIKVTGFTGTPSYLMGVIKKAEEMGYNWRRHFSLKKAWFTGEMLTPTIRQTLEQDYGINTSQAYAVSEVGGALAYECGEKSGLHMMDEYCIEIVDPRSGKSIPEGEVGEIVVTPITNPAWGLVRFGTGDLSAIQSGTCPCGRTAKKLAGMSGRIGDAVKARGMFMVSKQVEALFAGFDSISRGQVVVDRPDQRDELLLRIELKGGEVNRDALLSEIARRFQAQCLLRPDKIEFVSTGEIPESSKTITDIRKWV